MQGVDGVRTHQSSACGCVLRLPDLVVCGRYVSLLEASAMVSDATTSPKVCQQLQTSCAAITDWWFRFGAASVLMEVAHGTQDAAVRSAVVRGSCSKGTIVGCLARSVWLGMASHDDGMSMRCVRSP